MRLLYSFILIFLCNISVSGQPGSDPGAKSVAGGDFGGSPKGATEIRFGKINGDRINYADIKGSPFWNSEWQNPIVYINDIRVGRLNVKLNFATDELHYLKDSEELVLTGVNVTKLIFDKADSAVFIKIDLRLNKKEKELEAFVQVMNDGDYQLLKYTSRKVGASDSVMSASKRYFFKDEVFYFIKSRNKVERLKKLNKEELFNYLPATSAHSEWIAASNINFEQEADIIRFLKYYNSERKKSSSR